MATLNVGSGADGNATAGSDTNLNTTSLVGRGYADMIAYNVASLTSNSATLTATANGIAVDDLVLLINLQGDNSVSTNVGNYEVLEVASVSDTVVNFSTSKVNYYGSGVSDDINIGTGTSKQKVMLQRIPQYNSLTIDIGFSVYGNAWDFSRYGVFSVYVKNELTVNGSIDMSEKGYRYEITGVDHTNGACGGSIKRKSIQSPSYAGGTPNDTGGAGTYQQNGGGGGGGHATSGSNGEMTTNPPYYDAGGNSCGVPSLSGTMFFGGCAGGGGGHNIGGTPGVDWAQGGSGGGVIMTNAATITINSGGTITTDGRDGLDKPGANGGGGGAGGSIRLEFGIMTAVDSSIISEKGLKGTTSAGTKEGGDGSDGRIAFYHPASFTPGNESSPSAYSVNDLILPYKISGTVSDDSTIYLYTSSTGALVNSEAVSAGAYEVSAPSSDNYNVVGIPNTSSNNGIIYRDVTPTQ